jgi:hypothetical protein
MIYITKNISFKTLVDILSNGIIFIIYNLFYIDQIDYLDTCEGLVNQNRGSTLWHWVAMIARSWHGINGSTWIGAA